MKSRRRCSSAWSCSNASKQFLHWKLCQLVFKTARSWIWVKTVEVLRWYGMWSTILKIPINGCLIFFIILFFLDLSFSQPSKCFVFFFWCAYWCLFLRTSGIPKWCWTAWTQRKPGVYVGWDPLPHLRAEQNGRAVFVQTLWHNRSSTSESCCRLLSDGPGAASPVLLIRFWPRNV